MVKWLEGWKAKNAIRCLIKAANNAAINSRNTEAIALFRQALNALIKTPDAVLDLETTCGLINALKATGALEEAVFVKAAAVKRGLHNERLPHCPAISEAEKRDAEPLKALQGTSLGQASAEPPIQWPIPVHLDAWNGRISDDPFPQLPLPKADAAYAYHCNKLPTAPHLSELAQVISRAGGNPRKEADWLRLAVTLCQSLRIQAAEDAARQAIAIDQSSSHSYFLLGIMFEYSGHLLEAEVAFSKAAALNSCCSITQSCFGGVLRKLHRYHDAETALRRAIEIDRSVPIYYFELGNVLSDLGRDLDAIKIYRQAISLAPNWELPYNALGNALNRLNLPDEAAVEYRRAIAIKPNWDIPYNGLGNALKALGRLPEAEASCRHAIKTNPKNDAPYNTLGNVLGNLGRLSEADQIFSQAIRLNPDCPEHYVGRGIILFHLNRLRDAEAAYRQAIALNHGLQIAHTNLGNALLFLDQLPEAEESFRNAISINPYDAAPHYGLGEVFRVLRSEANAASCYRRAACLSPNPITMQSLRLCLIRLIIGARNQSGLVDLVSQADLILDLGFGCALDADIAEANSTEMNPLLSVIGDVLGNLRRSAKAANACENAESALASLIALGRARDHIVWAETNSHRREKWLTGFDGLGPETVLALAAAASAVDSLSLCQALAPLLGDMVQSTDVTALALRAAALSLETSQAGLLAQQIALDAFTTRLGDADPDLARGHAEAWFALMEASSTVVEHEDEISRRVSLRHRLDMIEVEAESRFGLTPPQHPDPDALWRDIVAEASRHPLVFLAAGRDDRGCAVIISGDGGAILPLDGLTETAVNGLAARLSEPRPVLMRELPPLCRELWRIGFGEVMDWLVARGIDRAVIIPCGVCARLPWAAAARDVAGHDRYAVEDVAISFAPSARSLAWARRRGEEAGTTLAAAADPPATGWPRLPGTRDEVAAIRRHFPPNPEPLVDSRATRAAVLALLQAKHDAIHFGCHGILEGSLLEAHLLLAGSDRLTVRDIVGLRDGLRARLVALTACRVGQLEAGREALAAGMQTAFLEAGAGLVLAPLWQIEDDATAMLMGATYAAWREHYPDDPARALCHAQRDMIATARAADGVADFFPGDNFSHPIFWAAFTAYGA